MRGEHHEIGRRLFQIHCGTQTRKTGACVISMLSSERCVENPRLILDLTYDTMLSVPLTYLTDSPILLQGAEVP